MVVAEVTREWWNGGTYVMGGNKRQMRRMFLLLCFANSVPLAIRHHRCAAHRAQQTQPELKVQVQQTVEGEKMCCGIRKQATNKMHGTGAV